MTGALDGEHLRTESALAARRWMFGAAILDERSLTLVVNDQSVELERKPLEVLLHLLHHAGEVVTKDELLAAVWPGRVLSDSALTSCMHKLRDALSDDAQEIIRTQHGYGYRLIAPVRVETSAAPPAPRFDFKPGDRPPLRPQWSLVQRLGAGGHGEAWLARHDKTRETRVFKFAADAAALSSLKREITLSRLLHDALGGRPDLVRVLDWNLEEAPYFVESGYSADGSLVDWALARGGLRQVPLETRVELAAQAADALAAAHSVGVLHKDLKPSNVLVDAVDGPPRIKLADFGSGGVLDAQRLEQLGITRMGFTRATVGESSGGTPLYLAPEVIAGQPFTLQADIYALGVLLYQLVAGDFGKPLAPGWEREVEDELLREDIAEAAEGNPEQRLADAARLAQRLRGLDQRRDQRQADRAARAAAENARFEVERIKARRVWVRLAIAATLIGAAVSLALFVDALRARDRAADAAATADAVSKFLSHDLFGALTGERRTVRGLTVKELLDGAGSEVDNKLASRPLVAARVHAALGASYSALEYAEGSKRHLEKALALFEQELGSGAEPALVTAGQLVVDKLVLGELPAAMPHYEALLQAGERRLGPQNPAVLDLRWQLADGKLRLGAWAQAAAALQAVVNDAKAASPVDEKLIGNAQRQLARALFLTADFTHAEVVAREALARLVTELGESHIRVANARMTLGSILTDQRRYPEAEQELSSAIDIASGWMRDGSGDVVTARRELARLRVEQNRPLEAVAILEDVLAVLAGWSGPERNQSYTVRHVLAVAYQRAGQLAAAEQEARAALAVAESVRGPGNPYTQSIRLALAEILCERKKDAGAWEILKGVDETMPNLPADHPQLATLRRVQGFLLQRQGKPAEAQAALATAARIHAARYGTEHWRAQRARDELATFQSTPYEPGSSP